MGDHAKEQFVSCPSSSPSDDLGKKVYKVANYVDFYFDADFVPHQVGADTAVQNGGGPWLIELNQHDRGSPTRCIGLLVDAAQQISINDSMTYRCSANVIFVLAPAEFIAGTSKAVFQYRPKEGGRAVGLTRDGETWMVRYSPFGSAQYFQVAVTRAWF